MTIFQPKNPDYERRVRDSFQRQAVMAYLGAQLVVVRPGEVEIHLPYKRELSQQHGFFHAGVVGTIADSAGGYAAFSLMPIDASVLTVEYKINLLAPSDGALLKARARVIKAGRTLTVCLVECFVQKDNAEKLCALVQMTVMTMQGMPDERPPET